MSEVADPKSPADGLAPNEKPVGAAAAPSGLGAAFGSLAGATFPDPLLSAAMYTGHALAAYKGIQHSTSDQGNRNLQQPYNKQHCVHRTPSLGLVHAGRGCAGLTKGKGSFWSVLRKRNGTSSQSVDKSTSVGHGGMSSSSYRACSAPNCRQRKNHLTKANVNVDKAPLS